MSTIDNTSWRRLLFLGGIIGGLALASLSALTGGTAANSALPPGAIARVNNAVILRADFVRALNAVSSGKRNPLSAKDKAGILQRLIEEELLIQRALDLGLAEQDTMLRNALVGAVTKNIISRSRAKPVNPVRLRDYYFRNKARFVRPARVFVRVVYFPNSAAVEQMAAFDRARASGITTQELLQSFGQKAPPVPEGLIPVQKLKDYIGPVPIAALGSLGTGKWSGWIKDKTGVWRLYLVNRTRARTPELSLVKGQVEAAYRDERDDAVLRTYLERLKRRSDIVLSTDAPQ